MISNSDHVISWHLISQKRHDILIQTKLQWNTNRNLHTPYSRVLFRMTLSDLEWLSEIFNDTKHCTVSLWQLSFFRCSMIQNRVTRCVFRYSEIKMHQIRFWPWPKPCWELTTLHQTSRLLMTKNLFAIPSGTGNSRCFVVGASIVDDDKKTNLTTSCFVTTTLRRDYNIL